MKSRALLLEIECCQTAIASEEGIPTTWATQTLIGIEEVPDGQTLAIDLDTFEPDAGGTQIVTRDLSSLLEHRKTSPRTLTTADASAGDATLNVSDTADFPGLGIAWLGRQAVSYTGKTGTTLTGCTWGALGSEERDVLGGAVVYGYNPTLQDRRCWLYWVDRNNPSSKSLRYQGYITKISHQEGTSHISILSEVKKLIDGAGLRPEYAKGRLVGEMKALGGADIEIAISDPDVPFSSNSGTGWDRSHLKIDDEIIEFKTSNAIVPKSSVDVVSVVSAYRLRVDGEKLFRVGDQFDIEDSGTGEIIGSGKISAITAVPSSTDYYFDYSLTSPSFTITAGDHVRGNYHALIPGYSVQRGAFDTTQAAHEDGAQVDELRVLEGDQLDIFFWLLFSDTGQGTGGAASGKWDILPVGWGLGLPASAIDLDTFAGLADRSEYRQYRFTGPVDLLDLLAWMGMSCNAYLPFGEDGVLRAVVLQDLYPDTTTAYTLDLTTMHEDASWGFDWDSDRVANIWVIRQDYDEQGETRRRATIEIRESIDLVGAKPLPPLQDLGIRSGKSDGVIKAHGYGRLLHRAHPMLRIQIDVRLQESLNLRPGALVTVNLPYIADGQGGQQQTATVFVLQEIAPADSEGKIGMTLIEHAGVANVALIAPAAYVASYIGTDVVIETQANSHFSQSGTEDISHWLAGDYVILWDVSTFGTGTVRSLSTTISAIDVGTRTLTLAAVPTIPGQGWTLAAGDEIRLDKYDTQRDTSPVGGERIDRYAALATGTPPDLDGDPAFVYGV